MKVEIINRELNLDVFGLSGIATNKNYADTGFAIMNKIWPIVKSRGLRNKGLNIWVYESQERVFAGVELEYPAETDTGLEQKTISVPRYAYHKHIGPYGQLKQAGDRMRKEIHSLGFTPRFPYIEIYGHWTNDETRLETELLVAIE